jgi:glycosyltransferase involved in cell wall biosynthesis
MKVNVAMLGSRNHYIIPVILQNNDLLNKFYTDSYIGNKPLLEKILLNINKLKRSNIITKWLTRKHDTIPKDKVISFEFLGIKYAYLRRKAKNWEELEKLYENINKQFCLNVVELSKKEISSFNVFYGFNGASLEIIEFCKQNKKIFILEQTLVPHKIEYEILNKEIKKFNNYEKDGIIRNTDSVLVKRELQEIMLADYIITASPFVKDLLIDLGIKSEKIALIPYGIETVKFPYKIRKREKNRPLNILFLGEIGLRKGSIYLLEALKKLKPQIAVAKFAGLVSLKEEILGRYKDRVEFLGHIPKSEVKGLLNWADILILPSLAESGNFAITEALASGIPVITTKNSGSIVEDGKTGFIVPVRDSNSIKDAIIKYYENPYLLEEHSYNAIKMRDFIDIKRYEGDILNLMSLIMEASSK